MTLIPAYKGYSGRILNVIAFHDKILHTCITLFYMALYFNYVKIVFTSIMVITRKSRSATLLILLFISHLMPETKLDSAFNYPSLI